MTWQRVGVVLAGYVVVAAALVRPEGTVTLVVLAAFVAGWEHRTITAPRGSRAGRIISALLASGCAVLCIVAVRAWPPAAWPIAAGAVLAFVAELALARRAVDVVAGPLYFGTLPAFLALLRSEEGGLAWVIVALAAAWGGSIGACVTGRIIGGRRLAPRISPAKTVSGATGGFLLGTALAMAVASQAGGVIPLAAIAWIAPVAQLLSQAGDLTESLLKRRCGVTDSGTLLGEQGGVLDCVDGLCLAAPFVFLAAGFARA